MGKKGKIYIIVMILCLCLLGATPTYAQNKTIELKVGKSKHLSVSMDGKVKWKSKNTNIVKISSKGKITGIKKGKTKIVATCGKQKKIFFVKVKNSYFKANFKNAKKLIVRNLDNGQTKEFSTDDISFLQSKINQNKFYRKMTKEKKATGDLNYMFLLYDENAKLLKSISFGNKKMVITDGEKSKNFISKKALNISQFEF